MNDLTRFLEQSKELGTIIARSQMFGCKTIEQGIVFAWAIIIEKKSPFELAAKYHLIEGNLSKKPEAMLAEFNEAGGVHQYLVYQTDHVHLQATYRGSSFDYSMTWEQAKGERWPWGKGGILKTNWSTPIAQQDMMNARVVSRVVRRLAPWVVAGAYTPQEISDFIEGEVVPAAIPHLEHFPHEDSTTSGDVVSMAISDCALQSQIDEIRRLGNECMSFDPNTLENVKNAIQRLGRTSIATLQSDEAEKLIIGLQTKINEHTLGESLAS